MYIKFEIAINHLEAEKFSRVLDTEVQCSKEISWLVIQIWKSSR